MPRCIVDLTRISILIWWKQTSVFSLHLLLGWKRKIATQKNICYMTGMPYYQVNADWLYLTFGTGKSQIANPMSKKAPNGIQDAITWQIDNVVQLEWYFYLAGSRVCRWKHLLTAFLQMNAHTTRVVFLRLTFFSSLLFYQHQKCK